MADTKIGQRIRSERLKRKISVRKFAHKLGMTHQGLSRIELGQVDVASERLQRIADILGVSPGSLFPRRPKVLTQPVIEVPIVTNGHKEKDGA
jgi:transcriptional regulator with XRE-family HTH domain